MTQEQALNILINAVALATKRGAFELIETETILQAVKMFTKKEEAPAPVEETPKAKAK